ncbi:MAG: Hsp33 family molecular chaperone HslO [Burkholderiales bacterium]|nr:Hsp33 family molecular chaperone HslO [Burkholderiales bacterium]
MSHAAPAIPLPDHLVPFLFEGADVRGAFVSLDTTWREVLARRDYAPPVRALLGEAMAAGALLAANLKAAGTLVLQTQSTDPQAPVRLMVVECSANLDMRATAKLGAALAPGDDTPDLAQLTGDARLVVTLDPRDGREAYQGVVPLTGTALGPALEHYMQTSEQVDSVLVLGADATRAAGLLLQRLPIEGGAGDVVSRWDEARALAATLGRSELLAADAMTLARRLFHAIDLRVFRERPARFACRCSRARVADMLRMLGAEEVSAVVAEQGQVAVDCEFCGRGYSFDAVDAAQLFAPPAGPASTARH